MGVLQATAASDSCPYECPQHMYDSYDGVFLGEKQSHPISRCDGIAAKSQNFGGPELVLSNESFTFE